MQFFAMIVETVNSDNLNIFRNDKKLVGTYMSALSNNTDEDLLYI